MSTRRFLGTALAVAQVQDYVFAGTWEADDVVTVTVGAKTLSVTAGSTTISTVVDNVVTAINALSATSYPEFVGETGFTASRTSNTLRLTAKTAGTPFTCTVATTEAGGGAADAQTIDGAASSTGTATTASAGPNDWGTAANWSGGAVPVNGDTVILENLTVPIKYGLDQNAVTLTALTHWATFTGDVGLPDYTGEYDEYRETDLKIGVTTCKLNYGDGLGSNRFNLNTGSVQTALTVFNSGQSSEAGRMAVLFQGTHASNVLEAYGNAQVGVALRSGETATVVTLNVAGGAQVRCSSGVTLTTTNVGGRGARLSTDSNITTATVTKEGGLHTILGGAVTTLNVHGGKVSYQSTGTVTTANVRDGGELSFADDASARTLTNTNIYAGAIYRDPFKSVTWTNAAAVETHLGNVTLDIGSDFGLQRS